MKLTYSRSGEAQALGLNVARGGASHRACAHGGGARHTEAEQASQGSATLGEQQVAQGGAAHSEGHCDNVTHPLRDDTRVGLHPPLRLWGRMQRSRVSMQPTELSPCHSLTGSAFAIQVFLPGWNVTLIVLLACLDSGQSGVCL